MEVRCDGLRAWRLGMMGGKHAGRWEASMDVRCDGCKYEVRCDGLRAWRSGTWEASMQVRCNGLRAWRSGVIGCEHGGQV